MGQSIYKYRLDNKPIVGKTTFSHKHAIFRGNVFVTRKPYY